MNCPKHQKQKMVQLFTSWACDVCDGKKSAYQTFKHVYWSCRSGLGPSVVDLVYEPTEFPLGMCTNPTCKKTFFWMQGDDKICYDCGSSISAGVGLGDNLFAPLKEMDESGGFTLYYDPIYLRTTGYRIGLPHELP